MEHSEILFEIIKDMRRLDHRARDISPHISVYTELDFDSLQMVDLIESIRTKFGVDLLATDNLLRDFLTPEAMAKAVAKARLTNLTAE
jgi:acyl carrier protein